MGTPPTPLADVPPSRHRLMNPITDVAGYADAYIEYWPWLWFACAEPDRPFDRAVLVIPDCEGCQMRYLVDGAPGAELPVPPADAPRYRVPLELDRIPPNRRI